MYRHPETRCASRPARRPARRVCPSGRPSAASVLYLLLVLVAGSGAFMGASAQEELVPLDEEGRIEVIDHVLAQRLGLFLDDYPRLRFVHLYQVGADSFFLEVTRRDEGRTVRDRVPMTADEVRTLRARVSEALAARAPDVARNQEGRFLLVGSTSLMGLTFYGAALPIALGIEDGSVYAATYLFTLGGSFVVPYQSTQQRDVTYGMTDAARWGMLRGIAHGLLTGGLLDVKSDNAWVGLPLAFSVGEGIAMYRWAAARELTAGESHVIRSHSDYGLVWSGAGLIMMQPSESRLAFAGLLAGAGAGLAVGASRAPRLDYTWGDAAIQETAFYLGAFNGLAIFDLILGRSNSDDVSRLLGVTLAGGSAVGMAMADRSLLPGHDFSLGQSVLVNLGTVAGGLLGAGVAALGGGFESDESALVLSLAAAGANAGFALTYRGLADEAKREAERRGDLEVGFNPAALVLAGPASPVGARASNVALPLLSVRYRF